MEIPLKPVYFPNTYLSPAVAAAIQACFISVVAYQPVGGRLSEDMRRLVQRGFLDIVAPPSDDDAQLELLTREFEQWGRLHHGGAGLHSAALFDRSGADPLSNDPAPAIIASEIKRRCAPTSASGQEGRPLMLARVFLHLAQQADLQAHQLRQDLERFEKSHAELFEALTGETAHPAEGRGWAGAHAFEPSGDRLFRHRIDAWARLFLRHPYPSPVFITASAEAIDLLGGRYPAMHRICLSDVCRTAPAAGLMSCLEILASGRAPAAVPLFDDTEGLHPDDRAGAAVIHLVPDLPPLRLFAGLTASGGEGTETANVAESWRHTVIVRLYPEPTSDRPREPTRTEPCLR
jgi:hypothetical protein